MEKKNTRRRREKKNQGVPNKQIEKHNGFGVATSPEEWVPWTLPFFFMCVTLNKIL
jgi:hypothetical protein